MDAMAAKANIAFVSLGRTRKEEELEFTKTKLAFLQQLRPSPLSFDFKGDVSFVAEGSDRPIQAHRFILASKSPVFEVMMEIGMKENLSGIIRIEGVSAAVIRAAVNFMYTSEIDFSDQVHPTDVLKFAHQYEIPFLKQQCEIALAKLITAANLPEIFSICHLFGATQLKKVASKFKAGLKADLDLDSSEDRHPFVGTIDRDWIGLGNEYSRHPDDYDVWDVDLV